MHLVPTGANTQPALASYLSDPAWSAATPAGLLVLTLGGQKIRAIARFHVDELYPRFGLPESLPEPGPVAFTEYSSGTCGRPSGM